MKTFYVLEPHVNGTTKYAVGDKREADENEVKHLVDLKVLGDKPPKAAPDYERDKLGDKALNKASREELLLIAAAENVDVPNPAILTPDLIKAIEAKRKPA